MQQINGIINEEQRIPEWYAERLGRFSCSQFYRLMTEPRSKEAKERGDLSDGAMTYVNECVAEKLTGQRAKEEFTSKYTDWGLDNEPIAKGIYNALFNCVIEDCKYIPYLESSGGSPDGFVGQDGIVEIKCPFTITSHLEHKLYELKDKPEYYWQCIGYLLITGREWIDFVSYHPAYPGKLQIVYRRLKSPDVKDDILRLKSKLEKSEEFLKLILNSLQ